MARKKTKKTNSLESSAPFSAAPSATSSSATPPSAAWSGETASSGIVPAGQGTVRVSTFVLSVLLALLAGLYVGTLAPGMLAGEGTETTVSARRSAPPQAAPQAPLQEGAQAVETASPASDISDGVRARILELEQHVRHQSDDAASWIQLGNLYFDISNPNNAIRAYERALMLTPDNPDVLTDLGVMYRDVGKFEMAEQSFKKAVQINPKHQNALFNRGVVLFFDLGRKDDGRKAWRLLLAVNPNAKAPDGRSVSDMLKTLK